MANRGKKKTMRAKTLKPTAPAAPAGIAPLKPPVKSFALEDWLTEVREHAARAEAAGSLKGACLVTDPQTGGNHCILTDEGTCAKLGGTWIGGPCGPD